ncbi:MAG: cyclic pyranopterin monophosphate synthase MoaC [Coriobacteriales bacterium]|jgi:cyclic pyranopterin phosphate synthase|nr:cyclic pyranopterin monophosphate synthase MoaC [Coriobacteriales bacterium]
MPELTHINHEGAAHMVDVGAKPVSERIARAEGFISMQPTTLQMIIDGTAKKGDVLAVARIAGIMAAKQTPHLIPLCHPINLTKAEVDLRPVAAGERADGQVGVEVRSLLKVSGQTGIEMEALTACSIACLTVYDMCKAVDRGMELGPIRLLFKDGGKSGRWERETCN